VLKQKTKALCAQKHCVLKRLETLVLGRERPSSAVTDADKTKYNIQLQ